MNIAFRVDASPRIGIGHYIRCLRLAEALREAGAHVRFVCRHLSGPLVDAARARGYEVTMLEGGRPVEGASGYAQWLGTDQPFDARATLEALSDRMWDWVVVDHYALDAHWEALVRASTQRLMAIDDLADRVHDCDVLLDPNFYADADTRYAGLLPDSCVRLLGPRYALLSPAFGGARVGVVPRTGAVRRLLICFGGVDASNHTAHAVDGVAALAPALEYVDVVMGSAHPHQDSIERRCQELGFACHVQSDRLAELMAAADLAIGAGGSMTWERCCLGVPSLVLALAENQRKLIDDGSAAGLIYAPEPAVTGGATFLARHTQALMENERLRHALSMNGMAVVDGRGVPRVLRQLGATGVDLREAAPGDAQRLFTWRNHPSIRAVSHQPQEIDWETHHRWFASVLANPSRLLLIGSRHGVDLGVVRFDIEGSDAEVSIYLAPDSTGRGSGAQLLAAAERWLMTARPRAVRSVASVRTGNDASHRLFASAGYHPESTIYTKALRRQ